MARQVHPREMVAHLWAHKAQDAARTAGNGSFYFTGATLFSYGSHFVCAHHMPEEYRKECDRLGSRPVALFNSGTYSMTTSRHMAAAWQALPGFIVRVDVPGLDANMVRGISFHGARDIVAALVDELRATADKAARPRIRPHTRAAHFAAARELLENALFFATVDGARRDISAPARKAARAMVRTLSALAIPEDGDDKAGAEALAFELNRARYVERMAELVASAERDMGNAVYNVECGNFATAERYMGDADRAAAGARDYAKKARRELPRKFARELRKHAPGSPWRVELETKARAEHVATARAEWADGEAFTRAALAAREFYVIDRALCGDFRRALETLHGEPGDAERREYVETLTRERDAWRAKSEAQRGAELLAAARELFAAGKFTRAADAASSAAHAFQRSGADVEPAYTLASEAKARQPEEFAAMLAAWRDAEPGARFPSALHTANAGAFLRLSADRRRVETSQGADVPARVCAALWELIGEQRRGGGTRHFNGGFKLGHFALDTVDGDGNIRAGCHFIRFEELADIAARLNFAPHN